MVANAIPWGTSMIAPVSPATKSKRRFCGLTRPDHKSHGNMRCQMGVCDAYSMSFMDVPFATSDMSDPCICRSEQKDAATQQYAIHATVEYIRTNFPVQLLPYPH